MKEKVGVCLIGAGRAGRFHARNYVASVPGARLVAIVDVVEPVAKAVAEEFEIEYCYTDYREALKNPQIDAVVVVAPTDMHKQIVIDSANAGKHVFCEKPMGMNVEECRQMVEACEKNGVKLQIGFMRRHDESFKKAKELVKSGAIGEVVQIHSNTRGPSKPQPWMYDIAQSNGVLAELNSHDIDSIRWFAESEIATMYAIAGNYKNREVAGEWPDYYDSVVMSGVFENGIQYVIDGGAYMQYGYDAKMEIIGTRGKVEVGRSDGQFVRCVTVENGIATPFIQSWRDLFKEAYLAEAISFIECVQNDTEPSVGGWDGLMAVRIVELGNQSIREGRIVTADE